MFPRAPLNKNSLTAGFVAAAAAFVSLAVIPAEAGIHFGQAATETATAPPRITFTKVLKGSLPEYENVRVDQSGAASCDTRKLSDPANPRAFKLSPATTQKIFTLAARLHNFQGIELDSRKPVANLGRKTLTYEAGGETHSVEFNYTTNRDAEELSEVFEGIVSVDMHLQSLEYSIRYDPLGLPHELSLIQMDLDRKALSDPELLAPQLEAIARDSHFLHLAQVRAENILHELRQERN